MASDFRFQSERERVDLCFQKERERVDSCFCPNGATSSTQGCRFGYPGERGNIIPNRKAVASFLVQPKAGATALRLKDYSLTFPRVAEAATLGWTAQPRWGKEVTQTIKVYSGVAFETNRKRQAGDGPGVIERSESPSRHAGCQEYC